MIPRTASRPDSSSVPSIAKHLLWTGALVAAALLWVAPATAAKACGQAVIEDWYKDGRVDAVYPIRCYRDALKRLPDDVQTYSDAPEVIERALQDAIQKGTEPPPAPAPSGEEPPDEGGAAPPPEDGDGGRSAPRSPESSSPEPGAGADASPGETNGVLGEAIGSLGSGSADSVPVPLLIIGGLALLLLAGGSAGLVARKLQARRIPRDERADPPSGRRPPL